MEGDDDLVFGFPIEGPGGGGGGGLLSLRTDEANDLLGVGVQLTEGGEGKRKKFQLFGLHDASVSIPFGGGTSLQNGLRVASEMRIAVGVGDADVVGKGSGSEVDDAIRPAAIFRVGLGNGFCSSFACTTNEDVADEVVTRVDTAAAIQSAGVQVVDCVAGIESYSAGAECRKIVSRRQTKDVTNGEGVLGVGEKKM